MEALDKLIRKGDNAGDWAVNFGEVRDLFQNLDKTFAGKITSKESIDDIITGKNINKANVSSSNKDINYTNKVENIDFSSSKFLKGDPSCINIMRVRVLGSLSYDELMYELRKRAATMGGNAIGIYDLNENKEIIYANKEIDVKNSLKVRYEFMKQTNLLSSVTADIFRCKSDT